MVKKILLIRGYTYYNRNGLPIAGRYMEWNIRRLGKYVLRQGRVSARGDQNFLTPPKRQLPYNLDCGYNFEFKISFEIVNKIVPLPFHIIFMFSSSTPSFEEMCNDILCGQVLSGFCRQKCLNNQI